MNRRTLYIGAFIVFIPIIIWYASGFSGLPQVTFGEAEAMADSVSKVLVPGRLAMDHEIKTGGGGVVFYLQDGKGDIRRVVYDGSKEVSPDALNKALEAREPLEVAGHMCSDGEGERFHAKNIYFD